MRKISLDIRNFALPSPLVGSIETHSGFGATPIKGQEIHQILQKKKEKEHASYSAEKFISASFEKKPYEFVISGRMDGIYNDAQTTIEEIKSSFDVNKLFERLSSDLNHPYIWQLRTYGYFHYLQTKEIPLLKMELISSRNFSTIPMIFDLNVDQYEEWLERRLAELVNETKINEKVFEQRLITAGEMKFPFSTPRPGQQELIQTVEECFENNTPIIIEAPTGLGKTAGMLYPALKNALSRGQKVVFVTPKNSQHQVAEAAVDLMQEHGGKIRSLTLTSKAKMCMKAETLCNPQHCEYALNYYNKLTEHDLVNKVTKMKSLTSKKLKSLGEKYLVCPFELSLEAINRADLVIGDYNYVFSPRSLIGRISEPLLKPKEKANVIIDEAHNLPARAQDYFSPSISLTQINHYENQFTILNDKFLDLGIALTREFIALIKQYSHQDSRRIEIDAGPFLALGARVRDFTSAYLESDVEIGQNDPVLGFSNLVNNFIEALELTGEQFFQTYQRTYNNEMLKITCCDASEQLKQAYKEFKNVAAFSATLKPFRYYQQLLGFPEDKTKSFEFASPFYEGNRKIMVIPQISTKYKDRSQSVPKISEVIERVLNLKQGNYIALFPSFEFMNMVAQNISLSGYQILIQQKEMRLPLINQYLNQLREGLQPTLLLGVQGGVFSEGVDYPGHMLIGAFIVGPALPNFDFEREQIRAYYEKRYGSENAFNYAYVYPAMAKAIQSAGRVVRTETDRGVIILIDPRFLETSYYKTMPREWFNETPRELVSQQILQDIKNFWSHDVEVNLAP